MRGLIPVIVIVCSVLSLLGASAGVAKAQDVSIPCEIYMALDQEPDLRGYPVIVDRVWLGQVTLLVPEVMPAPGGKRFMGRAIPSLEEMRESVRLRQLARQTVDDLPLILGVSLRQDHGYDRAKLTERRRLDFEKECRAGLTFKGRPRGARVLIDGRHRGQLPIEIEVAAGERRIVVEKYGYRPWSQSLMLDPGTAREVAVDLVELARLEVASQPSGAVVLLNGIYAGQTPATVYADEGAHTLQLYHPEAAPQDYGFEARLGDSHDLTLDLEADPGACPSWNVTGNLKKGARALHRLLAGKQLRLMMPLHQVRSSTMGSVLPTTHVVDGQQILFDARRGNHYEPLPEGLLGRELRGLSFGEVGVEVLTPPMGTVIVTKVEAKKSTLIVHLRHQDGSENAVYVDFSRPAKEVTIEEAIAALCWVAR